ncbi:MAG: class I SAM-dependent methyltransferase [Deltaproteobacteria bacterium]|nr:class I SAM-dependent methyltransferase [Deltaproteobacteria bacterium]
MARPKIAGGTTEYWDSVAGSVVARGPIPAWRSYSDLANEALVRTWLEKPGGRLLKTDLFDEAWTGGFLWSDESVDDVARDVSPGGARVGIDLSPVVAGRARARRPGASVLGADVRRLPFPDATFEAVVSPSTLDHFADPADIGRALVELHRVLAPGGRLLITLDNPTHPLVAVRALGVRLWRRLGVVPYEVGVTLDARALHETLEATGFEVLHAGAAQHFPRVLLIAVDRLLGSEEGRRRRLVGWALRCERLDRLPSRYWTGQFVCALARRRG